MTPSHELTCSPSRAPPPRRPRPPDPCARPRPPHARLNASRLLPPWQQTSSNRPREQGIGVPSQILPRRRARDQDLSVGLASSEREANQPTRPSKARQHKAKQGAVHTPPRPPPSSSFPQEPPRPKLARSPPRRPRLLTRYQPPVRTEAGR
jgi:hypothetical protein